MKGDGERRGREEGEKRECEGGGWWWGSVLGLWLVCVFVVFFEHCYI